MKKNLKKLVLNKSTLSNLENENIKGGIREETIPPYCADKTEVKGCCNSHNNSCYENKTK